MAYHIIKYGFLKCTIFVADKAMWLTYKVADNSLYLKIGNIWKGDILHICGQHTELSFTRQKLWPTLVICAKSVAHKNIVAPFLRFRKNYFEDLKIIFR